MLKRLEKRLFQRREIEITPVKMGAGWLASVTPRSFDPSDIDVSAVHDRVEQTNRLGQRPLWKGYEEVRDYPRSTTGARTPDQVQTAEDIGAFYTWLAGVRKPDAIVEFGAAFGVSGMFWLTGLHIAGAGRLMTYEPNDVWANIAEDNLRAISDKFVLTRGIFEERAAETLATRSVDIAFIDAIHTSEFVYRQYDVLKPYLKENALVLFDDIGFSADMNRCWQDLATRAEVVSSFQIEGRVGLVELRLDRD